MSIFVGTATSVFIKQNAVGMGTTTTAGRDAGVSTATGTLIYNTTAREVQVYNGNAWTGGFTSPFSATGGSKDTTSRSGFAVHTFTGPGTFTVNQISNTAPENVVSYTVIGGGGGGGFSCGGGGGGAGGFREVKSPITPYTASPLDGYPSAPNRITITAQAYPITVGGGGSSYFSTFCWFFRIKFSF